MKKTTFFFGFVSVLVATLLAASGNAASVTTVIAAGGYSNLLGLASGRPAVVKQVVVTSPATTSARVILRDSPTGNPWYTNAAYVTEGLYATNVISTYVDFFNNTNSITNVAMVHYSITNAATTNLYAARLDATAPTNSTAIYDGVNYNFINGVYATNASAAGSATVTVTYQ